MEEEPKLSEVLEAVKDGFGLMDERFMKVDEKFMKIDERFMKMDERFDAVDKRFDAIDQRFDRLEKRTTAIETGMVTKNYLDEKLGVVGGKISALTNVLQKKGVITEDEKRGIYV
ncbi:MAG: hypothetical protein AAB554_03020 [Patescibacteria group bacterium]